MKNILRSISIPIFLTIASVAIAETSSDSVPIKLGMLLPLSGNYAELGTDCKQGLEVALELFKPKQNFEFIYADSKAEPAAGIVEFRKLVSINQILGSYVIRSTVGMPLNPISNSLGIPILGGVGHKDFTKTNEHAFQAWSKSFEEGIFLANLLRRNSFNRIALVTAQDDWTSDVSDGFRRELTSRQAEPNSSGSLVYDEDFVPAEIDFALPSLK